MTTPRTREFVPPALPAHNPAISIVVVLGTETRQLPADWIAGVAELRCRRLDLDLWIAPCSGTLQQVSEATASPPLPWIYLTDASRPGGFAAAALAGLRHSLGRVAVVLDAAELPAPAQIRELVSALDAGADFALGVPAGGLRRRTLSGGGIPRGALALLARPLARSSDPTSRCFALRRVTFERGEHFDAVDLGEIALELLVRCRCERVREIPLRSFVQRSPPPTRSPDGFALRARVHAWLRDLRQLRRLYIYKYDTWSRLMQYGTVGMCGAVFYLSTLTLLLWFGVREHPALALAILANVVVTFALHRRLTFSDARGGPVGRQFLGFTISCGLASLVNYAVTFLLRADFPDQPLQLFAAVGHLTGGALNFTINRFVVFRRRR